MPSDTFIIRPIRPIDDPAVATIISDVMTEHGCTGDGFALHDPEVQAMHQAYGKPRAGYFVAENDGIVVGGAGFAQLAGTTDDEQLCELRKMYFRPEARGRGLGRAMLALCLDEMRAAGFQRCYLETTSWMDAARKLYVALGFEELPAPLGSTGHHGCDRFFARPL